MVSSPRVPVQTRGSERKRALLDAVVRLLARHGARGVTHRAVAAEAGTTHGATRYYFATSEEMLSAALSDIIARQVKEVEDLFADRSDASNMKGRWARFAAYLGRRVSKERDGEIARYELFLDAARSPRLQAPLRAWGDTLVRLLRNELSPTHAKGAADAANALLNLINGLMLQQLAAPRVGFEKTVLLPALIEFVRRGANPS